MQYVYYPFITGKTGLFYEFFSNGPRGTIKKIVVYQQLKGNVYNLLFGDWNKNEKRIEDNTRSNNGDRDKILATVARTLLIFMECHPKAIIFAKGQTPAKTRLYQMGINQNWKEIGRLFFVAGLYKGKWEIFRSARNYQAFLVKLK